MKYRGIFEYEYPTEHKPPVSIDVHLHGDCVKGKIIEWEYRPLDQEPTTKNNIPHCQCTDAEIAKSFIEDVEAVKDQLPTTTNDLGVDCISRTKALDCVNWGYNLSDVYKKINDLPSVTPQEPQTFKWCETCKEYDQEKHCCHRWSKVIRDTVEEMKQEQEPFINKSCVSSEVCEHDKQNVLDKIRTEIDNALSDGMIHKKTVLGIIDKYKAESEDKG